VPLAEEGRWMLGVNGEAGAGEDDLDSDSSGTLLNVVARGMPLDVMAYTVC
jgi:hypothetical protein